MSLLPADQIGQLKHITLAPGSRQTIVKPAKESVCWHHVHMQILTSAYAGPVCLSSAIADDRHLLLRLLLLSCIMQTILQDTCYPRSFPAQHNQLWVVYHIKYCLEFTMILGIIAN